MVLHLAFYDGTRTISKFTLKIQHNLLACQTCSKNMSKNSLMQWDITDSMFPFSTLFSLLNRKNAVHMEMSFPRKKDMAQLLAFSLGQDFQEMPVNSEV